MSRQSARPFVIAAIGAAAIQIAVAVADTRSLETPNASTEIAQRLVASGEYGADEWVVLHGPGSPVPAGPLRAYQLPGEPLYLAAGFALLPAALWRFLALPLVVLLVVAAGRVGTDLGGRTVGAIAMAVVALDPFIARHGPVWDDTILGAALQWTAIAIIAHAAGSSTPPTRIGRVVRCLALVALAGYAAITRASCALVLAAAGLIVLWWPRCRRGRLEGAATLAGVAAGLTMWGVRNLLVLGVFFMGSSHDGITIWRATSESARASLRRAGVTENVDPREMAPLYRAVSTLGEVDTDRYYRDAAFSHIAARPLQAVRTATMKIAVSLTGVDLSRPLGTPRNAGVALVNLALLVTGVAGWRRLERSAQASASAVFVRAAGACALIVMASLLALGPVGLRYRLDLTVLLAIGVAASLAPVVNARPGVHV